MEINHDNDITLSNKLNSLFWVQTVNALIVTDGFNESRLLGEFYKLA